MRSEALEEKQDYRSVVLSIVLHVAIVALFTVKASLFPSEAITIEGAIHVDVVDLPDKFQAPPKPVPVKPAPVKPKPKPKAKPKPKPKPNTVNLAKKKKAEAQKRKDIMKAAIEKARALEKIQEEVAQEQQAAPIKGNETSTGNDLDGIKKLQYDNYISVLKYHIQSSWSVPAWLADLNLKAKVLVKITPQGFVKYKKIVSSSGNESYDDLVLSTVDKASPFPTPSDKFKDILSSEGFVLGFPE